MLRLTGAPYFVLGSSGTTSLRLRIDTRGLARQRFKLKAFEGCGASRRASPSSAGRRR